MSCSRKIVSAVILSTIAVTGWTGHAWGWSFASVIGIAIDQVGSPIGQISPGGSISIDSTGIATVPIVPRPPCPPSVALSTLAPITIPPVNVKIPSTLPVGFCVSGDTYDRHTGLCGDGKPPYKIVPVAGLNNPASQTP